MLASKAGAHHKVKYFKGASFGQAQALFANNGLLRKGLPAKTF
jgi:hypothetical protein